MGKICALKGCTNRLGLGYVRFAKLLFCKAKCALKYRDIMKKG